MSSADAKSGQLRWPLADENPPQQTLFSQDSFPVHRRGSGEWRDLEFLEVKAKRILNPVPEGSRMGFRWTLNAYRGCSHACTYCFARPSHEWLGLGIGSDFERRLVVKVNAPERARAELSAPSWKGELVAMGTNTDPYQRAEGRYRLTRRIVEVLSELRNPFSILTKSTLVLGDLDLLAAASERTSVRVNLSVGTLDERVWRASEPGTPHPRLRLQAVSKLNEAGVPCGVLVAPVLPGLSDSEDQLRSVVQASVEAGAVSITPLLLHLRPGVREHYLGWLESWDKEAATATRQVYQGRAYLPVGHQKGLAHKVSRMVAEAREAKRLVLAGSELGPPR